MTVAQGAQRRLIAIDFDGTLADTWPWFADVLDEVADVHGFRKPACEERQALRHLSAQAILRSLGIPLWKAPGILADVRRRMQSARPDIAVFAGMPEAVAALSATGAAVALVSSNSASNVRRILGPAMCGHFDAFECGTDLFGKTAKLKRLLKRFDCVPAQSILIGDELRDIEAAHAAGMIAAAVAWGYNHPDALRAASPDVFFQTPGEIRSWCAALPARV